MDKEAYFWEWSHYLAAGYLEHPPLVAWVVALTSGGIGEGPVAAIWIRRGAFAFGLGTLFLIARLSRQQGRGSLSQPDRDSGPAALSTSAPARVRSRQT